MVRICEIPWHWVGLYPRKCWDGENVHISKRCTIDVSTIGTKPAKEVTVEKKLVLSTKADIYMHVKRRFVFRPCRSSTKSSTVLWHFSHCQLRVPLFGCYIIDAYLLQ